MCIRHNKGSRDDSYVYAKRRMKSNLFTILFFILLISVFVQIFIFRSDFKQYFVELILVIFSGYYMIVGNIKIGVDLFDQGRKKRILILNVVLTSSVSTIIFGIGYYFTYQAEYKSILNINFIAAIIVFAMTMAILSAVAFSFFELLNLKKEDKKTVLDGQNKSSL